jgi:hypothetical protein
MTARTRRGIDYEDPVQDVISLKRPLTREVARQLSEQCIAGVKPSASRSSQDWQHSATDEVLQEIAAIPRLRSLHCQDIVSGDEGFMSGA